MSGTRNVVGNVTAEGVAAPGAPGPPAHRDRALRWGHAALGATTVVIAACSLAFLCTIEDDAGATEWVWPQPYSPSWFAAAAAVAVAGWAVLVTRLLLGRDASPRPTAAALTLAAAATLGACGVYALAVPTAPAGMQLWLVCAMNLGYQGAHLRSLPPRS